MQTLESIRLKFEPLSLKHLADFHLMENDPEVLKYYRREISKDTQESQVNLEKYLTYAQDNPGLGAWCAFSKQTGEFIGLAVVIHLNKDPKTGEIEVGYRLPQHQWGKGFATEIAQVLIQYSFQKLKLKHVFGTTHPENLNSQKVLQKVGFKIIGDGNYHGGEAKLFKLELSP